jgi:dihydrofolate synthase/folylpolyglutamate synthase
MLSQKIHTVLVSGTNGKSLTINFAAQLLKAEGITVGTFYTPHLLTYNERFAINHETISNKLFTEIANEVINTAESLGLTPNSYEILTMMSLLYFHNNKVDVALLEVSNTQAFNGNAPIICHPKIAAITRVTADDAELSESEAHRLITSMLRAVQQGTHVICADQSKLNLQTMLSMVEDKGGIWGMPIRKLVPLAYPFEQLHGRCAALAERIAFTYINSFAHKNAIVVADSLLTKKKSTRGRPRLEVKRQLELNPKRTVEQFWKETVNTLPGRFQLLDKEKPTILLDNANNLDAFKNLLLGIRLLHYQKPLKGLTLVIGCNNTDLNLPEFFKTLRYFFKKTSGTVIICPVASAGAEHYNAQSWNVDQVINDIKTMKIKAKAANSFKEAFEAAQKSVDERHGLVAITGSSAIVAEYWTYKGIKRL